MVYTRPSSFIFATEKVHFRSQILECPSIGEYWNISGVPVLPENVILMFFKMCWCYSEAYNTGMQKWSSIVQYLCTSIWDLKYTFSGKITFLFYCFAKPSTAFLFGTNQPIGISFLLNVALKKAYYN